MIESGKTYVVMGLLDGHSIAYAIGRAIARWGGRVVYTIQNEYVKTMCLDVCETIPDDEREALEFRYCDVTENEEVAAVFGELGEVAGVVHSVAYANPKTCLGETHHTATAKDLGRSFQISCVSLATVVRHALPAMPDGGSVVTMTFDSSHAFTYYNWMSVNKAGLEALIRGLAREHGKEGLRVNGVSSGPLHTMAASRIPGFEHNIEDWKKYSPIGWDIETAREDVAQAAAFLLGPYSKRITGQILFVDGGASALRGYLQPHEKA